MAVRLLFYWWANSLMVFSVITQVVLAALCVWAATTLFGTRLLAWVFEKESDAESDLA